MYTHVRACSTTKQCVYRQDVLDIDIRGDVQKGYRVFPISESCPTSVCGSCVIICWYYTVPLW